jgi:hypothetical protein
MTSPPLHPYTSRSLYPFPKGVKKVRKPKMRDHAGRTWDQCDVYLPDGQKVVGFLDTTWGTRFYFTTGGWPAMWFAASIDDFDTHDRMSNVFCLRAERDGFRIGDTIALSCNVLAGEAQIVGFYDTPGGVRVEPALDGFNSWNVDDLQLIKRTARG